MYALILTEPDVAYCLTYTFERQDLWDWLHQRVEFPKGESDVDIPMPAGYPPFFTKASAPEGGWPAGSAIANVTIGSTQNDLAIMLVQDGCLDAGLVKVEMDDVDDDDEYLDAARETLLDMDIASVDIYEGMLY